MLFPDKVQIKFLLVVEYMLKFFLYQMLGKWGNERLDVLHFGLNENERLCNLIIEYYVMLVSYEAYTRIG